jgi:glycosyltransferase involved in cell wall biosynthesis
VALTETRSPNVPVKSDDGHHQPASLTGMKVLIVHDWLIAWAGAERCLEEIVRVVPQADVVVSIVHPSIRELNSVTRQANETWAARIPGARNHHRWFLPLQGVAFATLNTANYDLIISSSHAFAKMVRPRSAKTVHLCYCYTPPRYLWDLHQVYRARATVLQRLALTAGAEALRYFDRRSSQGVDRFVGISRFVADRIRRSYNRDADVVYPPVVAKGQGPLTVNREGFALSLGRLVPYKRLELAIAACRGLGIPLVIAGDGPDRARLEQLADRRVEFLGNVSEAEAGRLLDRCGVFLFCAEEDFGIAPLEANAHGAPVVAYKGGGALETMIEGRTAEFFSEPNATAVGAALRTALKRSWDQAVLRENAARFAPARFRSEFIDVLQKAVADGPKRKWDSC